MARIALLLVLAVGLGCASHPVLTPKPPDNKPETVKRPAATLSAPTPVAAADEQPLELPLISHAVVKRVVDGDTFDLQNGWRVRLLGINAPESVKRGFPVEPFGPEASAWMHARIEGKRVRLVWDKNPCGAWNRLVAWVYEGGTLINEESLRAGMSKIEPEYLKGSLHPDLVARLNAAEKKARDGKVGVWSTAH
jgi:endonuclease YncB( thermonuclease family)